MIGVAQHYTAFDIQGSFNSGATGVLTGTVDLFFDDSVTGPSSLTPWVIPTKAFLKRAMVSFGPAVLTPAYDIDIYKNGVLHTTIAIVLAEQQSVHDIAISVDELDEISMNVVQTSGVGNTFEDVVVELFS